MELYGPVGSREASVAWFKATQAKYLRQFNNKNSVFVEWFHGIISRREAEHLLESKPVGCFLVRVSETRLGYTLSFRDDTRCRHYLIEYLPADDSYVIAGETTKYLSLAHLVRFYQRNHLQNWNGFLTEPCPQVNGECDYLDLINTTEEQQSINEENDYLELINTPEEEQTIYDIWTPKPVNLRVKKSSLDTDESRYTGEPSAVRRKTLPEFTLNKPLPVPCTAPCPALCPARCPSPYPAVPARSRVSLLESLSCDNNNNNSNSSSNNNNSRIKRPLPPIPFQGRSETKAKQNNQTDKITFGDKLLADGANEYGTYEYIDTDCISNDKDCKNTTPVNQSQQQVANSVTERTYHEVYDSKVADNMARIKINDIPILNGVSQESVKLPASSVASVHSDPVLALSENTVDEMLYTNRTEYIDV